KDLPDYLQKETLESSFLALDENYTLTKENFERQYFSNLLQNLDGNISKAAKTAGLSRQHFHLKIKKLGIKQQD
ncbi:MAG: helix-turn-helix domain-containing protein, partial [Candidatus Neomarinimicrobiota bacterium]